MDSTEILALLVLVALVALGIKVLRETPTPINAKKVNVHVTIMLDEQILTDDAWTHMALDRENAARMGATFLDGAIYEEGLSRHPTPQHKNELTALRWPNKGWRIRQSVLTDDLTEATLVVVMRRAERTNSM